MPRNGKIDVTINTRPYTLQCAAGEEARLRQLADFLDSRVSKIAASYEGTFVTDAMLLVLAGLTLADELAEANHALHVQSQQPAARRSSNQLQQDIAQDELIATTEHINKLAQRIDSIAKKIAA